MASCLCKKRCPNRRLDRCPTLGAYLTALRQGHPEARPPDGRLSDYPGDLDRMFVAIEYALKAEADFRGHREPGA